MRRRAIVLAGCFVACALLGCLLGCSAVRPASTRITPGTASSSYTKIEIITPNDRDRGGVLAIPVPPEDGVAQ